MYDGIIRKGNGHEIVARANKRSGVHGRPAPAEGLPLQGYLSDSEEGAEISGTTVTLVARSSSDHDHEYAQFIPAATVDPLLATRSEIWEVVVGPNARRSRLLRVVGSGSD